MINDLDSLYYFIPLFIMFGVYILIMIFCVGRYHKALTPEIREIMKLSRQDPNYLQSHPEAQEKIKEFSRQFLGNKMYTRMTDRYERKGINPFVPQQNVRVKSPQSIRINPDQSTSENKINSIEQQPNSNWTQNQEIDTNNRESFNQINKIDSVKSRNFAIVDGNTNPKYFICPFCGAEVKIGKDVCPKCKNSV